MADSWFMMKNDFSFDHAPFSPGQRRKNKPQQTSTPVLSIRWIPVLVTFFTSSIRGLLFLSQCGVSTVVAALPGDSGGGKRRLERLIRPFASQREIQTEKHNETEVYSEPIFMWMVSYLYSCVLFHLYSLKQKKSSIASLKTELNAIINFTAAWLAVYKTLFHRYFYILRSFMFDDNGANKSWTGSLPLPHTHFIFFTIHHQWGNMTDFCFQQWKTKGGVH